MLSAQSIEAFRSPKSSGEYLRLETDWYPQPSGYNLDPVTLALVYEQLPRFTHLMRKDPYHVDYMAIQLMGRLLVVSNVARMRLHFDDDAAKVARETSLSYLYELSRPLYGVINWHQPVRSYDFNRSRLSYIS